MIRALSVAAALTFTLAPAGTTERVSVSATGDQAEAESWGDAISVDGRFVLFDSHAPNLVPGDTNGQTDVFVRDLQTGETTRVDVASDGKQARLLPSHGTSISADGRYVVFTSEAGNLVPGDSNDAGLTMSAFDGQGGGQNMTNPINSNAISASVSAINITKIVPGGTSGQQFGFSFNPPGDNNTTPFMLGDGGTEPFPNLNPGMYVVTEPGETGFTLTSILCTSGATVTRDVATGTERACFTVPGRQLHGDLALSPDGQTLASCATTQASPSHQVLLWDLRSERSREESLTI